MFKNYFLIAFRNLKRNKVFSLINLLGLAIGMAVCLLIMLMVQDDLSYNRGFENSELIHQVIQIDVGADGITKTGNSTTPYALGPILKEENPEIIEAGRIRSYGTRMLEYEDSKFYVNNVAFIDPALIDVFSLEFITGSKQRFIGDKQTIMLSESSAAKFFGNESPINKPLKMDNNEEFIVRGVYKDLPDNTNIRMDYLLNISLLGEEKITGWSWESSCYVQVHETTDMAALNKKIEGTIRKHADRNKNSVTLHPFEKIKLYTTLGEPASIKSVLMVSLIAFIILVIACINFMNLGVARSINRAREVGIRKVVGASDVKIRYQFLGESIIMAILAACFALVLVEIFLPFFNNLVGKSLNLNFNNIINIFALFLLTILVGFGAGSYPALVLSRFNPVHILKSSLKLKSKSWFRTGLVVFQFTISIVLIIFTLTIFQQVKYVQNKDMGFERDMIYSVNFNSQIQQSYDEYKQELMQSPYILDVTAASSSPFSINHVNPVKWEGKNNDDRILFNFFLTDPGFGEFFEIELIEGRYFSNEIESDKEAYILNEKAVEIMGLEHPLGKRFTMYGDEGIIVGVIKDFHFQDISTEIGPIMLTPRNWWRSNSYIKLHPEGVQEGLEHIKMIYENFSPNFPMQAHFLDTEAEMLYYEIYESGRVIKYFAILAIFISCLGLFGLSTFMIKQKTREIGIRKVMGASVSRIVTLFSKNFLQWVVVANVIAIPIGYIVADNFFKQFAYHADLSASVFLISTTASLVIALLTTVTQTLKAANRNPVEALKYE